MRFTSENITLARRRKNDSSCFIPFPVVGGEKKVGISIFQGHTEQDMNVNVERVFREVKPTHKKNHHMCVDIDSRLFYSNEQITG